MDATVVAELVLGGPYPSCTLCRHHARRAHGDGTQFWCRCCLQAQLDRDRLGVQFPVHDKLSQYNCDGSGVKK